MKYTPCLFFGVLDIFKSLIHWSIIIKKLTKIFIYVSTKNKLIVYAGICDLSKFSTDISSEAMRLIHVIFHIQHL